MKKTIIPMLVAVLVFGSASIAYASEDSYRQMRDVRDVRENFERTLDSRLNRNTRIMRERRTGSEIREYICNRIERFGFAPLFCDESESETSGIVINEIYDDPSSDREGNGEWVELYNAGSNAVMLDDWSIADSISDPFAFDTDAVLLPGEFALVGSSPDIFTMAWAEEIPDNTPIIVANIGAALNNNGDAVFLFDSNGELVDSVSYGSNTDAFDPSVQNAPKGSSLTRNPNGNDTDTASDWIVLTEPTPGM